MKNNIFSSFKGLYSQLNTKNDFIIFKHNNKFFSVEKSDKHIKQKEYISDIFVFLAVIIYFSFIRSSLLNNKFYVRIVVFVGLLAIALFIGSILKTLFDKKQVKENNLAILRNQDVVSIVLIKRN